MGHIKLSFVATDITGVSARAMLEAIVQDQVDPTTLSELARGRLRNKREALEQALTGVVRDHHRFLIAQHLTQIDFLDQQIAMSMSRLLRRCRTCHNRQTMTVLHSQTHFSQPQRRPTPVPGLDLGSRCRCP